MSWRSVLYMFLMLKIQLTQSSEAKQHYKLLLVSFDGFRWDYLNRTSDFSSFSFIKQNGVVAEYIQPPFPSQTSPSHTTLVTGLYPESHGVIHNVYFNKSDPSQVTDSFYSTLTINEWWDNGDEPIWITASSQGLKSGGYLFPGSNATIGGVSATRSILETVLTPKDEPDWRKRIDETIQWFTEDDFDFIALYFEKPDVDSHQYGPNDQTIFSETLPLVNRTIAYLLSAVVSANLQHELNIIISSDHGMYPIDTSVQGDDAISIMNYVNRSMVFFQYSYAALSLVEPYPEYKTEVYEALKDAHPHMTAYYREDVPERLHYTYNDRITSLVLIADPGHSIYRKFPGFHINAGEHGYDNEVPEMRAVFMAIGPSFKKNYSIPGFESIHVYPLMCHLLGLEPAPNNGSLDVLIDALDPAFETTTASEQTTSGSTRIAVMEQLLLLCVTILGLQIQLH